MPIITGGWTVDAGYVEYLDRTGEITTIFEKLIKEAIKQKLCDIEVAGTLSQPEKNFRDSLGGIHFNLVSNPGMENPILEKIKQFIRKEAKWSRGMYMPFADLRICIDNQWVNILKTWTV